jgi:hypothetical protein
MAPMLVFNALNSLDLLDNPGQLTSFLFVGTSFSVFSGFQLPDLSSPVQYTSTVNHSFLSKY